MRYRRVLGLLAVLLLGIAAGCSSSNQGKIEGTRWSSESGVVKGKNVPAGAFYLDFRKDGTLSGRMGPQSVSGTYTLGWGSIVTLNLDQALSNGKTHTQKIAINGNSMTMTDPDGTSLTFRKVS